jgi:hypothetical protein
LVACDQKVDPNTELAKQYLNKKGYSIVSYKGNNSYTLYRHTLINDISTWAVQSANPDKYIGKDIIEEIFIVKNHPLSTIYGSQEGFTDQVQVNVLVNNRKVIGGTSVPIGKGLQGESLSAPPYSLEGKLPGEILRKKYSEWYREWLEKYSDYKKGPITLH